MKLLREVYANLDTNKVDDILLVHGRKIDISLMAINRHYRVQFQAHDKYFWGVMEPYIPHILYLMCDLMIEAVWRGTRGLGKVFMTKESRS